MSSSSTSPAASPRTRPAPRRVGLVTRALALLACLGCIALLVVAAFLRPDIDGHGTHTQLGLPPCAWAESFGYPCATCGMTTAFAHAARGDLLHSAAVQPFGALMALGVAAFAWGAGHVAATGSALGDAAVRALTSKLLWVLGGLLLAAWGYKLATWTG